MPGKKIQVFSGLCVLLLLAGAAGFSGCAKKKDPLPTSSDSITVPMQLLTKTTLYAYTGPYKRWKLDAQNMRKPLADTGTMVVTPVKLTIYDTIGNPETMVFADTGTTTVDMQTLVVWGDVLVKTQRSMVIRSQKLWWNRLSRKVESNTFVRIETGNGDILKGKGLDAVEDFSSFSFKSDVSGSFPDFKQRIEQDENAFF